MSKKLKRAMAAVDAAQAALAKTLKEEYPIGAAISWVKEDQIGREFNCSGTVIEHGYGDRIRVENRRTGTEYWIHAWRICRA